MSVSAKWNDLKPRLASALVLLAIGGAAVWAGGLAFHLLVSLLAGVMTWELVRLMGPKQPSSSTWLGLLAAAVIYAVPFLPAQAWAPVLLAPALVGLSAFKRDRWIWALYCVVIMLGCFSAMKLREDAGLTWVVWLAGVVVVSDVAGYFAGRLLGGPKFWPRVSPKKTWSGTVAGWLAAAAWGWWFVSFTPAEAIVIPISILLSFAAQMGDICESAIKRRFDVKDSSNLIPGHGGFLDRFDAMLGALLFVMLFLTFLPVIE